MDATSVLPTLSSAEPPVQPAQGVCVPALAAAGEQAAIRLDKFVAGTIRNPHTCWPDGRAVVVLASIELE